MIYNSFTQKLLLYFLQGKMSLNFPLLKSKKLQKADMFSKSKKMERFFIHYS